MKIYVFTCLVGFIFLWVSFLCLGNEQEQRRKLAKRALHAQLIPVHAALPPLELDCKHYIIGRNSYKVDMNLEPFNDPQISRLHAELWFDGKHFHLVPFPRRRPGGIAGLQSLLDKSYKQMPTATRVNGVPVGLSGVLLKDNDYITFGGKTSFKFMSTTKGGPY